VFKGISWLSAAPRVQSNIAIEGCDAVVLHKQSQIIVINENITVATVFLKFSVMLLTALETFSNYSSFAPWADLGIFWQRAICRFAVPVQPALCRL